MSQIDTDEKIEFTPEMIGAGIKELALCEPYDAPGSTVMAIYRAMAAAARLRRSLMGLVEDDASAYIDSLPPGQQKYRDPNALPVARDGGVMSEMAERVARAILARILDIKPDEQKHKSWEDLTDQSREDGISIARAAIAALREPTEAMKVAGAAVLPTRTLLVGTADEMWRAMIDAAAPREK